ncbi:MAG TPA: asparagine synthase (glutamine-hydrolyzing), partial [Victivallales bacterium]|nr:asparagine synthase (glutamine-hydrolyzing) [Victivallales bacterium]
SAIISFEESALVSNIFKMTDIVRHRGPDDEGFAVFGNNPSDIGIYGGDNTPENVYSCGLGFPPKQKHPSEVHGKIALGHRRLSIIDLSAHGHQPMSYKNGRYWIVYNGEIYNHIEIRDELKKRGHCFVSNTDTEVILAAYDEWAEDCLQHFNGMWAFVIYDTKMDFFFASRDRFGVKPLYVWRSENGTTAFASEIKQFTCIPGWKAVANKEAIYDFLINDEADHTEKTFFRDVVQVRGGEMISCKRTDLISSHPSRLTCRWHTLRLSPSNTSLSEASEIFKNLFEDSVRLRLRSDVPVGTGLSGGLDSSSIVCVATKILRERNPNGRTNTFSACSHDKEYDEKEFIEDVLRHTDANPYFIYPEADDIPAYLDEKTWFYDEPFFSTSTFAEWEVFKKVSETPVKVTLDGRGADGLLAGYHMFFPALWSKMALKGQFVKLAGELRSAKIIHGYSYLISSLRLLKNILTYVGGISGETFHPRLLGCLSRDFQKDFNPKPRSGKASVDPEMLSRKLFFETSLPVQLHWSDRDSMAHSIESRAPFLDYRIVEYLSACPENLKIGAGTTKLLLRESMRGILPDRIRNRRDKIGFITPEKKWIQKEKQQIFRKLFNEALEPCFGIIDETNAIRKAEMIFRGKAKFDTFIWKTISLGNWIKKFSIESA